MANDRALHAFEHRLSPAQASAVEAFQRVQRIGSREEALRRLVNIALAAAPGRGPAVPGAPGISGHGPGTAQPYRPHTVPSSVSPQSWALLDSSETAFAVWE